jgi:hypothetical protein
MTYIQQGLQGVYHTCITSFMHTPVTLVAEAYKVGDMIRHDTPLLK